MGLAILHVEHLFESKISVLSLGMNWNRWRDSLFSSFCRSGVLNTHSLEVTHVHCPPPCWLYVAWWTLYLFYVIINLFDVYIYFWEGESLMLEIGILMELHLSFRVWESLRGYQPVRYTFCPIVVTMFGVTNLGDHLSSHALPFSGLCSWFLSQRWYLSIGFLSR